MVQHARKYPVRFPLHGEKYPRTDGYVYRKRAYIRTRNYLGYAYLPEAEKPAGQRTFTRQTDI